MRVEDARPLIIEMLLHEPDSAWPSRLSRRVEGRTSRLRPGNAPDTTTPMAQCPASTGSIAPLDSTSKLSSVAGNAF
jgi:hypothetical protein